MSPRPARPGVLIALSVLLVTGGAGACASAPSAGSAVDPNRITAEEMADHHETDLLSLIRRLRPRWLQARGSATFSGPTSAAVLVDNMPRERSILNALRVADVAEVEFLSASDATTRFGTNMAGGAILVRLRR